MPAGRPTECTPEAIEKACAAAGKGIPLRRLCDHIGVDSATFWRWMARSDAPYSEFRERVKAARAEFEARLVGTVSEAPERWQAQAWLLERSYGYRVDVDDAPPPTPPDQSAVLDGLSKLPRDLLEEALRRKG